MRSLLTMTDMQRFRESARNSRAASSARIQGQCKPALSLAAARTCADALCRVSISLFAGNEERVIHIVSVFQLKVGCQIKRGF